MMTFFLSNTIESQLLASGAFEIYFNGKIALSVFACRLLMTLLPKDVPIWSKLATGRVPSAQELFTMIDNQNKFYSNDMYDQTMHTIPGHAAL